MIVQLLVCSSLLAPPPGGPAGPGQTGQPPANAYYYFMTARLLESQGDIEGAIKSLQEAATLDPKSAEVRGELAGLYGRQGRATEAVEWANAALRLDKDNAEANRVLGIVYGDLAKLDEEGATPSAEAAEYARKAIQHLETARGASGLDPRLGMLLGRLYLRTGATDQAIGALRRLVEQEPDRPEPILLLAQAYERAGRPADATSLLEGALSAYPEFNATLGGLYEGQHRWSDAAQAYERALSVNPRSVELKTRLATALLSAGDPAGAGKAATLLQQARAQRPADSQILYLLSRAQRVSGNLDEAETTAKSLKALEPSSFGGAYALAEVYREKQDYRQVVATLEPLASKPTSSASQSPEALPAVLTLALAYQELGQFDRALAVFEQARALAPGNQNIDVYVLATLVAAKRYPAAVDRSQALLEKRPDDQRVVRLRAEALGGVGRLDEGLALLRGTVEKHGDDMTSYLALSELQVTAGQYDAAVKLLMEAAKKFPSEPTVTFQLGSVFERQKKYAEAERAFRDVLAKDPLFAPALNYFGYMLADRGVRLDESVGYIKRALKIEPYNGAYLDSLGWAYFKSNRLDLAEENLHKAAEQRVRDSAIHDHYGDVLFRLGRYQEAIGAWRQALDGDGEQIDRSAIDRKIRSATERAAKQ